MESNRHNVTKGLVHAILLLTEEQRRSSHVQSVCQYIYCKFSINDYDDNNGTCINVPDRLPLPDGFQIDKSLPLVRIAKYIILYIYPFFIFMGIFGNSLSCFIMFLNVRRNGYSANLYLTLLAFVDCLFLLGSAFPYWIANIHYGLDIQLLSDFCCRFVYWFGNFITHLSAGLVISVTVERFIAIQYPLLAHKINTVKNTHIVLIILISFFFLLDSRVFILVKHFTESIHIVLICKNDTNTVYERRDTLKCGIENEMNEQTWVFIDFAVYTLIPFLIIITFNSLIIYRLIRAQHLRQSMSYSNKQSLKFQQENSYNNYQTNSGKSRDLRRCRSVPAKVSRKTTLRQPLTGEILNNYETMKKQVTLVYLDSTNVRSSIKNSSFSPESSVDIKIMSHHHYQNSIMRQRTHTNNIRLTILLLVISGSFLILTLPAVVLNLILSTKFRDSLTNFKTYLNLDNENYSSNRIFYYTIARLLMIINHSVNFMLYFVVGKRFRRDLKILCAGYWRKLCRQRR